MKKIFFILFISLFVSGCVATYIRSSSNPDFYGKRYGHILVLANLSDIESQQTVENSVAESLTDVGLAATPSYRIFFQGNSYTPEQRAETIRQYGFDSVLTIQFTDSYETQTYVPSTTTTYGSYDSSGFVAKSYQTGGYYLSKPNFVIRSKLQDANTFGTVWVSDSNSHGCAMCSFSLIMGSFSETVVHQLKVDGFLKSKQKIPDIQIDPLPPMPAQKQ